MISVVLHANDIFKTGDALLRSSALTHEKACGVGAEGAEQPPKCYAAESPDTIQHLLHALKPAQSFCCPWKKKLLY